MNIETLRSFCLSLPHATEDVKWGHDLCFCIAEKMFCVTGLEGDYKASFKVSDEEFDALSTSPGIIPAPYMARHKWVLASEECNLSRQDWERHVRQSYDLVKSKLPKKILREMEN